MKKLYTEQFHAIGTLWHIDITHSNEAEVLAIYTALKKRIEDFEQTYSRFRKDSLVSKIAEHAGVCVLPQDAIPMFDMYRKFYVLSNKKMTPLIGQALHDTGYDAEYSLIPKKIIREIPLWDAVMKYIPLSQTLTVYTPSQLDFGAIGKGYIIDIVSDMLKEKGITDFTVDAGRDIYYTNSTSEPLVIGLENPSDTSEIIGTATITHGAICGTSGNRRTWSTYNHILDPETRTSPKDIIAIWVTADTTMLADALTTALFFTLVETLRKHFLFECVIVYSDRSAFVSEGFPGGLF
jgi:FAD:protein FMN transferase